jgi:16S rRNA processing protein RimM
LTGLGHDRGPGHDDDRAFSGRPAGRIGRAHGLDGSFYVTGANPRLLELGARVTVVRSETVGEAERVGKAEPIGERGPALGERGPVEIVRRAGTDKRPIVRLAGVAGREAAESLRGRTLTVADVDLPELDDGEYWAHELEGCRVLDGERKVGVVVRLVELPSCEALEVALGEPGLAPAGPESAASDPADPETEPADRRSRSELLLVPMVGDAIRSIDVGTGTIDVDMGFVEGD